MSRQNCFLTLNWQDKKPIWQDMSDVRPLFRALIEQSFAAIHSKYANFCDVGSGTLERNDGKRRGDNFSKLRTLQYF